VRAPLSACAPLLVILRAYKIREMLERFSAPLQLLARPGLPPPRPASTAPRNPFSPKALRASAGAALHLPILAGISLPILLAQLKVAGARTLASSVHESRDGEQPSSLPGKSIGASGGPPRRQRRRRLPEEVERSADAPSAFP